MISLRAIGQIITIFITIFVTTFMFRLYFSQTFRQRFPLLMTKKIWIYLLAGIIGVLGLINQIVDLIRMI